MVSSPAISLASGSEQGQPTCGEGSPYGRAIWADACDRVFSARCIVQCMLTIASRLDVMNRLGRALADPTRSRIILTLLDHPAYPAELARDLDLTRPNVSNHLACLRDCGIVVSEPEGRRTRRSEERRGGKEWAHRAWAGSETERTRTGEGGGNQ